MAGAFTHPSCMVYPPECDEPELEVEPEPQPQPDVTEWRRPSVEVAEPFKNPSKYFSFSKNQCCQLFYHDLSTFQLPIWS